MPSSYMWSIDYPATRCCICATANRINFSSPMCVSYVGFIDIDLIKDICEKLGGGGI